MARDEDPKKSVVEKQDATDGSSPNQAGGFGDGDGSIKKPPRDGSGSGSG